ncbi:hypothetical protein QTP88_004547 [Uroleucon formosanum]
MPPPPPVSSLPEYIRNKIVEKRRSRALYQRTRLPSHKFNYNKLANSLKKLLTEFKSSIWQTHLMKLTPLDGSLWRETKQILSYKSPYLPIKKSDRSLATLDIEKAELFKDHLTNTFQPHADIIDDENMNLVETFLNIPFPMSLSANSALSDIAVINAGVPQGGILSSILYNIFASEQPTTPNTSAADYADDKAIISTHNDPLIASKLVETSSEALQPDNVVVEYSSASSLITNIDDLNDNSFDTNVTNICQTVIVDQSYPSNVDTRTFSAEDNQFTIGCLASSSSNLYTRISEHERSKNHENNFEAFLLNSNMSDITQYLLAERDMKFYRGAKDAEAAYTLNDPSFDHGNFLEMVMLLSKYDPVLKEHTDRAIYKSQKSNNRQTVSRPGQPVGLVTFLSKTTVDYIIEIIGSLMKTTIAENIRKVPFFTIQIDSTTQDVNVHDQLAIIIRFTTDDINEKLLAIIDYVKNCIGSSTDGASNMRGQYNGFSSWLSKESPEQVHVWCYAHVLKLVMIDTTQTKGMNVVHAFSNVKTTISTLQSKARDFNHIKDLTRTFIEWANCKMDDIELDYNIEEKFPMKRIKKKKKIPGEIADDEAQTDPMLKFNINVYNVIYDQIITSLKKRFETHGQFYNDLQFLIPEYFTNNLPSTVFEWISKKLKKFDSNISPGSIQSELKDFIEKWPKMKNIASATITINDDDVQENNEEDKNEENNTASSISLCLKLNENLACKNCIICCFQVLQKYNLHSSAYRNLYIAYKYILTLSCSQVRCETTFSKFKYVLNRLRNCLSQSKLETFLIMSVEKDVLVNLNNNEIINELSKKNTKMANLLNM